MNELIAKLKEKELTVATAESCTGGLVSKVLTDFSGSSRYIIGGVVAYSNSVKENILGVEKDILFKFGAVSAEVAEQMAFGVQSKLQANIGISTTGVAGPTGGTKDKPVGTVWMGFSGLGKTESKKIQLQGSRDDIRNATVVELEKWVLTLL